MPLDYAARRPARNGGGGYAGVDPRASSFAKALTYWLTRKTYSLLAGAMLLLVGGCQSAPAQTAAKPAYRQVFYEGANWLAGRPLLHYSPAFQSKSAELVPEPDSTKRLSPGALLFDELSGQGVVTTATTVQTVGSGNEQQLTWLAARSTLARTTLTTTLNTAGSKAGK